jgi:hypothetical protein
MMLYRERNLVASNRQERRGAVKHICIKRKHNFPVGYLLLIIVLLRKYIVFIGQFLQK